MSAGMPGVAAANPAHGEPATRNCTKTLDSCDRVLRTGRCKTAVIAQPGADDQPIAFNQYQEQCAHARQLYASECPEIFENLLDCCEHLFRAGPGPPDPSPPNSLLVQAKAFAYQPLDTVSLDRITGCLDRNSRTKSRVTESIGNCQNRNQPITGFEFTVFEIPAGTVLP